MDLQRELEDVFYTFVLLLELINKLSVVIQHIKNILQYRTLFMGYLHF